MPTHKEGEPSEPKTVKLALGDLVGGLTCEFHKWLLALQPFRSCSRMAVMSPHVPVDYPTKLNCFLSLKMGGFLFGFLSAAKREVWVAQIGFGGSFGSYTISVAFCSPARSLTFSGLMDKNPIVGKKLFSATGNIQAKCTKAKHPPPPKRLICRGKRGGAGARPGRSGWIL